MAKLWLAVIVVLALLPWVGCAETARSLDEQLIAAVKNGNLGQVKTLLDKGADANARLKDTSTVLMWGAASGNADLVRLLLDKGADLHAMTDTGFSPLMWAAVSDRLEVVKLLKSRGAEMTLWVAAMIGDQAEARRLLEGGADVNAQDSEGWTPLMNAARKGHAEVVKLLLENGADPTVSRVESATAVDGAIKSATAFDDAIGSGQADVVKVFLDKNPELIEKKPEGRSWSPLARACIWGQAPIVKLLLDKGAHAKNVGILKLACLEGQLEVVDLLLKNGADVNEKSSDGYTPLMAACKGGDLAIVKLLLDRGADINAVDNRGLTALDRAGWNREHIKNMFRAFGAKIY